MPGIGGTETPTTEKDTSTYPVEGTGPAEAGAKNNHGDIFCIFATEKSRKEPTGPELVTLSVWGPKEEEVDRYHERVTDDALREMAGRGRTVTLNVTGIIVGGFRLS